MSIIVPIYNAGKYLGQCLDSIVRQTYHDLEIILVNDGSTDNSETICKAYVVRDSRIKLISQENRGVSAARNVGLENATGKWVQYVDADDWLEADAVENLLSLLERSDAQIAICNVDVFYDEKYSGVIHQEDCPLQDVCLSQAEVIAKLAEPQSWYYITFNKLMKRELFDHIRFPEGFFHEDAAVMHRLYDKCACVVTTTRKLYHYRQADGSTMNSGFTVRWIDNLYALADRIQFSNARGWTNLENASIIRFVHMFFDYYACVENLPESKKHIARMGNSLRVSLPYILKSKEISNRHKLYLLIIRNVPWLYRFMRMMKKG